MCAKRPDSSPCQPIQYALPSKTVALDVLKNRLALLKTPKVKWATVQKATEGLSHAKLARACEHAVKNAILGRRTTWRPPKCSRR